MNLKLKGYVFIEHGILAADHSITRGKKANLQYIILLAYEKWLNLTFVSGLLIKDNV